MTDCQVFYKVFQDLGGNYPLLTDSNCCKFDKTMVQCDSQGNIVQITLPNFNTGGAQLPADIGTLKKIRVLQMPNSKLTGSIPLTFTRPIWSNMDLSNNSLTGNIPELQTLNVPNVYFSFRNNNFAGQIPANLTRPGLLVDNTKSADECPFDTNMCPFNNVKPYGCNSTAFTCSIKGGSSSSSAALSTGLIAAIGIGGALLLIVIVVGTVWHFKRGNAKVSDIKPRSVPTMYHTEISNRPYQPPLQHEHPMIAPTHQSASTLNMPLSHSPVAAYSLPIIPDNRAMPAAYSGYSDAQIRSTSGHSTDPLVAPISPSSAQFTTPITAVSSVHSGHTPSVHSGYVAGSMYSAHQYVPTAYSKGYSPPIQSANSAVSYKAPSTHSHHAPSAHSHRTPTTPVAVAPSTVYNPDDEFNDSARRGKNIQQEQSPKYIDLDQPPLNYQKPEEIDTQSYQTPDGKVYTYQTKKSPLEYVSKEITNRSSAMQFANQLPLPVPQEPPQSNVYYDPNQAYQYTYVDPSQIQAYEVGRTQTQAYAHNQVDPSFGYTFVDPSQLYYVDQEQVEYQNAEHFK
ncbi:hypothetical protein HDV01_006499 [Terramyces sp. JEL0728]|nr:hypothetical protein HDV01_006499 [Terramyces sp. JEL0728]